MMFNTSPQGADQEIFNKNIPFIALVGIFGNPVFYLICKSLGFYDNFILRITASGLFLILFIFRRNTNLLYSMYSEFVYFFTLPFLFSFFLYANNQNLYWKLSMLFAGSAYGMLSRKVQNPFLIIPLSCTVSFVLSNFFIQITLVSAFYDSIPTIVSALGCALVMIVTRFTLKSLIYLSIEMTSNDKQLTEQHKLKKIAEDTILLQRDIHSAQRLRVFNDLLTGILKEIENTLVIIKNNSIEIASNSDDTDKKKKIQTVLNNVENGQVSINHILHSQQTQPED